MTIGTYKKVLKHAAKPCVDTEFKKWLSDMEYEGVGKALGEYLREAFAAGSLSRSPATGDDS